MALTRDHLDELNRARVRNGPLWSNDGAGLCGLFMIDGPRARRLTIIAHDGVSDQRTGWEHVSVSMPRKTPTWAEMCFVKRLFWGPEEEVVQFHPRESEYVNVHEHVLHLWRPIGVEFPCPRGPLPREALV